MTLFTDLCGNSQSTLESLTAKGCGARDSLADAQGRLGSVISTDLQVKRRPQLPLCELTSRSGAAGHAARVPRALYRRRPGARLAGSAGASVIASTSSRRPDASVLSVAPSVQTAVTSIEIPPRS